MGLFGKKKYAKNVSRDNEFLKNYAIKCNGLLMYVEDKENVKTELEKLKDEFQFAVATNDALSQNLPHIGTLITRRSVYFVPMIQDDPIGKPHSLVASMEEIPEALEAAMESRQLRPIFRVSKI